jgi:hypothetical protein
MKPLLLNHELGANMQTMKYTNCKWCGRQLDARNGVECYRCWNLRGAIESNIELASQILAHLTKRAADGAYCSCKNPDVYINRICQLCGLPHAPRQ